MLEASGRVGVGPSLALSVTQALEVLEATSLRARRRDAGGAQVLGVSVSDACALAFGPVETDMANQHEIIKVGHRDRERERTRDTQSYV